MKALIITLFVLASTFNCLGNTLDDYNSKNESDTTVLSQILSLQLHAFIGKPVDSLLVALPSGFANRNFIPAKIGRCKGIAQGYGSNEDNHVFVQIFIDTFQFMIFPNITPSSDWDMNLAKKETISFIKVWKNGYCVYACNHPRYPEP